MAKAASAKRQTIKSREALAHHRSQRRYLRPTASRRFARTRSPAVRRVSPPFDVYGASGRLCIRRGARESARRHLLTRPGSRQLTRTALYVRKPDRDPREHRIAVAYYALVPRACRSSTVNVKRAGFPSNVCRKSSPSITRDPSYALELRNKVSYAMSHSSSCRKTSPSELPRSMKSSSTASSIRQLPAQVESSGHYSTSSRVEGEPTGLLDYTAHTGGVCRNRANELKTNVISNDPDTLCITLR